jgi:hypothetical protein
MQRAPRTNLPKHEIRKSKHFETEKSGFEKRFIRVWSFAVHHEVQYLYFTYAMARQPATCAIRKTDTVLLTNELNSGASYNAPRGTQAEVKFAASFLLWPVIGFVGAVVGGWLELEWLAPLGVGGLFCHYWLDGRIWTRQSFQN